MYGYNSFSLVLRILNITSHTYKQLSSDEHSSSQKSRLGVQIGIPVVVVCVCVLAVIISIVVVVVWQRKRRAQQFEFKAMSYDLKTKSEQQASASRDATERDSYEPLQSSLQSDVWVQIHIIPLHAIYMYTCTCSHGTGYLHASIIFHVFVHYDCTCVHEELVIKNIMIDETWKWSKAVIAGWVHVLCLQ